ncbi:MAG: TIR domain-containing protein [Promethearchaeota archaeon]
MKSKKLTFIILLILILFQSIIGLINFNLNSGQKSEVEKVVPEISDIIVGNYTFPGYSGSVDLNNSIRIGLLHDKNNVLGDHNWKGAFLAAKEINEAGGIIINSTAFKVGLVAEDTNENNETLDVSKGLDAANRVISYDPHCIIGGYRNESLSAYLELIMNAKIPFLSTGVAQDEFCQNVLNNYAKYKYFFRVMPYNSTNIGIETINHYLWQIFVLNNSYSGWLKNVTILRENLTWSVGLSNALQQILPIYANFLNPITEINISTSITYSEMEDIWEQINASKAQLVIPIFSSNASINVSKAYAAVQPKCLMMGIDIKSQINDFWDNTEGTCQYEAVFQAVYNISKTSKTMPFWNNFVNEYNIEPYYTGIGAYEAVYMLANVSKTSQSLKPNDIISGLEGFDKDNPFIGPSNRKAFWGSHDLVYGYPYAYGLWCQWQLDGKKVVIHSDNNYPGSIPTGSLSLPYWGIHDLTVAQDIPEPFTLSSNAGKPDSDGSFDLTWTNSNGADSYSVYMYNKNISYVSKRFALKSYKDVSSPFPISGLRTGDYYFIVAAYNGTGERLSNNIYAEVDNRPGIFTLSKDADFPVDTNGSFNLTWSDSDGADNYSIYRYNRSITEINESLTIEADQTATSPFPITGLLDGKYYFVAVAYNGTGERLSNIVNVTVDRPGPGSFTLDTDADAPDKDGTFNLNWTASKNADNYSIYRYNRFITEINGSLTIEANQTATSPFPITGLSTGNYYFVVVAYNETGETLSNNVNVTVGIPPGQFTLSSDAVTPFDIDGIFNLNWTESAGADNYSIYQFSSYITHINDSLIPLMIATTNKSFQITDLPTGFYYFIVVANNSFGYRLSNCINVSVQIYNNLTGYWIINPLLIDNTGTGDYTWQEVVIFPWCSGSGTLVDPYVVAFININGLNLNNCLTIRNSNVYFRVINCIFYNSSDNVNDGGIKLISTSNGDLIQNNCSFNNANGIVVDSCNNILIRDSSINHNEISGIVLIDSTNIHIIFNTETINSNELYGIHLFNSHYNNITGNTINYNEIGIFLESSNYNLVDLNNLLYNGQSHLDNGIGNDITLNNIFPEISGRFPFDLLIIILIICLVVAGVVGAVIIVKKRTSTSGMKKKEISDKKRQKVRRKLEAKLIFVDELIEERNIKSAYKYLGKIQDTADMHDFFDIFNSATKKIEDCKNIQQGIYEEVKRASIITPVVPKTLEEEQITAISETAETPKHNIFISYSTIDSEHFQINKIVKKLKKYSDIDKVLYWEKDSKENIVEFMDRTLQESDVFILFCSERSIQSAAVSDEWQAAFQRRKKGLIKMIPVYEDEKHIPPILGHLLNVKYTKFDFDTFIEKLHREILR